MTNLSVLDFCRNSFSRRIEEEEEDKQQQHNTQTKCIQKQNIQ